MPHVTNLGSTMLRGARAATVAAACLLPLTAAPGATNPGYAVTERWQLGGAGGWDYLTMDAARQRLFITRGDHVEVIDSASGKPLGRIPNTEGVHGVALAPELKRGYTSNGRVNSITEFDYDTLAVLREVPVPGVNPDAILYEPAGRRLYTFNGRSSDVTVFDAGTLELAAKIPVPGKPEFAVDDGHGHVYVNIETAPGQLVRIDSARLVVDATWPLPGCDSPSGLAIDRMHARLFSVCDGNVMVITDGGDGHHVARVPIGAGSDAAAFDAAHGLAFSSNGEGTLTVVRQRSADRYQVLATVPTRKGARTLAIDPASRRIFLVTADFGRAPPATAAQPRPRPVPLPDTFTVLVVAPR